MVLVTASEMLLKILKFVTRQFQGESICLLDLDFVYGLYIMNVT